MKKQADLIKEKGIQVFIDGVNVNYNKDTGKVDINVEDYKITLQVMEKASQSITIPVSEEQNLTIFLHGWCETVSSGCIGTDISFIYENLDDDGEVEFAGHYGCIEAKYKELPVWSIVHS